MIYDRTIEIEYLRKYLIDKKYDGLSTRDSKCWCELRNLVPCSRYDFGKTCVPGKFTLAYHDDCLRGPECRGRVIPDHIFLVGVPLLR